MARYLMRLADPQLVSNIQRFCGVRPSPSVELEVGLHDQSRNTIKTNILSSPGILQSNSEIGDSTIRKRVNHLNGYANDKSSLIDNGCNVSNGDSPRTETLRANGHAETDPDQVNTNANGTLSNNNGVHIDKDGVTPSDLFVVDNKLLYYIFGLGAELGNESFYIIFYPYFFWNIDSWMARRVCWFWSLFMYIGQASKDVIKWPRPASPPVFRLERKYAFEYGMPSTHAMVAVGLPFLTLILTAMRYECNWPLGLLGTFFWFSIVCFSRLYLGMHSILDVLAGITLCAFLMPFWLYIQDPLDEFLMTHPYAPFFAVTIPLIMCLNYPKLEIWSTCRSDTTLVLGTGTGVALSLWINYQYGLMTRQVQPPPYTIPDFTLDRFREDMYRMFIGGSIALIMRFFLKFVTYRSSCWFFGLDPKDPKSKQEFCIELPVKFGTYLMLSIVAIVFTPIIFMKMGIGRPTLYTEM